MIREHLIKVVCIDLDGSISNDDARRHLLPPLGSPLEAWYPFHQACADDTVVVGVAAIISALYPNHQIHFVSGRPAHLQLITQNWLAQHNIPYDAMRLYGEGDRPLGNAEFKSQYILQLKKRGLEPILFIEDLPKVADHIELHAHVPVLCVNPRYKIS